MQFKLWVTVLSLWTDGRRIEPSCYLLSVGLRYPLVTLKIYCSLKMKGEVWQLYEKIKLQLGLCEKIKKKISRTPSSTDVKNMCVWSYTSTPPCAVMAYCLIKLWENFTLFFTYMRLWQKNSAEFSCAVVVLGICDTPYLTELLCDLLSLCQM